MPCFQLQRVRTNLSLLSLSFINEFTAVCQEKSTHEIIEVTNKDLNSVSRGPDHSVSPPSSTIALSSFLRRLRSSPRSQGLLKIKDYTCRWIWKILNKNKPSRSVQCPGIPADGCDVGQIPIDILPDEVLLGIFDHYVGIFDHYVYEANMKNRWVTLVHVCQRWRNVGFGSPCRLNLQLVCSDKTPVRRTLDIWPPLPIIIIQYFDPARGMDNILAALEHVDRISRITLTQVPTAQMEKVVPAMQKPFPALTHLQLTSSETPLVAADIILGGPVPRLRVLTLDGISFRGLPKLLLSTTDLVVLDLGRIPHSAYISPETMVMNLSRLTRLLFLCLGFKSPQSRPHQERRRPPPPTRTVLFALKSFLFRGASEYLEDLVSRIDTPQVDVWSITFFHQLIFDTPQLTQFISRIPTLKAHDQAQARLVFYERHICVTFPLTPCGVFALGMSCKQLDWQLSSMAQICISSFPQALPLTVDHLYILESSGSQPHWLDDIDNSQWLEILRPFTTVKNLYLSKELARRVVPSLQELVGGRATELLPALQSLFLEELHPSGLVEEAIGRFVGVRQSSNHPIAVSPWKRGNPPLWILRTPEDYPFSMFLED